METTYTLHQLIQTSTAQVHEELEALPFLTLLLQRKLPKTYIVNLYHCLEIIHESLEKTRPSHYPKLPLIVSDKLAMKSEEALETIPLALEIANCFGEEILRNKGNAFYLLGVDYVLEGSQNGGAFLKAHYAENLDLPKESITYFGCYGSETRVKWKQFTEKLNQFDLTRAEQSQVDQAANQTFEWIRKIYTALSPELS